MEKHVFRILISLLLVGIISLAERSALSESRTEFRSFSFRYMVHREDNGLADSFVTYPEFVSVDSSDAALIGAINQKIQSAGHVPEYLQLLRTVRDGGTGLKLSFETSNFGQWNEHGELGTSRYASILFSAEGKMLQGRPGQAYYPVMLDLNTGDTVSFEALFTDAESAKKYIESHIETEIEPTLSTYLENNQLFPVPYDRFFLDGFGNLILVYESSQLSFLSGLSGAVSFRYSELWDWLDTSPDGIPMLALWGIGSDFTAQYIPNPEKWNLYDLLKDNLKDGRLPGLNKLLVPPVGTPLDEALDMLRAAGDSDFYPGGACYEVEEPTLRGALLLIDEEETTLMGILTSRVDCYGIETGKTTLDEAIAMIGKEPAACLPIDETTAERYRVCAGTMAMYTFPVSEFETARDGAIPDFTLYADEAGVVQYLEIKLK